MAEQHYQGGCHCGGVPYEVDLDLDKGSLRCNWSRAFARAEKFALTSGEGPRAKQSGRLLHGFELA